MTNESEQAEIELSVGNNELRMVGSEDFLSNTLDSLLDRINLEDPGVDSDKSKEESSGVGDDYSQEDGSSSPESEENSDLYYVADRLNADPESLDSHFYIQDDEIHIQDPLKIEPKYALLGYCSIREILTEEPYHNNQETKKKLIDQEKVEIDEWGSQFLHNLRRSGLIKDNPNVDQDRNKPFKIMPKGRRELIEWLNEDN